VCTPHVLIRVEHVDVARAGSVRLPCDRPRERRVLDEGVDAEDLAGLQVEADLDGESRVLVEPVVGHGRAR
jgi:hypothetical protein